MSRTRYLLLITTMVLLIGIVDLHAQPSFAKSLSDIINSKAKDEKKLEQLYLLKKGAEDKHQTNDSGYVAALLNIANYESDKKNNFLASSLAFEALQSARHFPSSRTLVLRCYYNVATFLFYLSQYDRAVRYYDTVIELSSRYDPSDYLLNALYYHTYIDEQFGDYERMINESKLGTNQSIARNDTAFYGSFLYFSAYAFMIQDQLATALKKTDECILLSKRTNNIDQLANAYNIKAGIYAKQKNYELAEQFYKMALQCRHSSSYSYSAIAIDYNDLGIFYLNEMHDFHRANACFRNAIQYSNKCPPEQRPAKLFLGFCNLGDVYAFLKQPIEAIQYYSQALKCVNVNAGDFVNCNPELKELNPVPNKDGLLSILSSKCILLLNLYKTTHKKIYLQNCIRTSVLADSLITQMRHEQLGEKSKLYWRNKTRRLFSDALEACYISGNADSAFYFMEKSRSVLLRDKLNELASNAFYLPKKEIDKETDLQRKIITLEKGLTLLSPSSPQYTTTENILLQTKEELEKYIKSIERNNPRYYQYKYADDIPSLSELKDYVGRNNQSFIYYFVNDSAVYALGISKIKTEFIKVLPAEFNSHQLSGFIQLCSNKQATNSHYELFASLAQTIYSKLFQPLHIRPGKVAICTDNFFIPFEALCTDNKGKHFLLNDYSFDYVYSGRSLLKPFVCNNKPEGDFAGFAPVSFSSELNVFPLMNSCDALKITSQYYNNNILFTQHKASRYNFLNQASKYAVVTIFSHAQADTTDKEPVLYMQDSLIHLSELQMLNNSAIQFVLLSACQTNIGKNATGEGIYSLARGFAAAGVPAVSATLWKADEEVVYSISAKFNEYLAKGMNKSEALQQAKIWYLKNSDREHALPYYWANMVLIGSSDPILLSQSNYNWLWLTASLFVILLIAVYFIYMYKMKYKKSEV